MFLISLMAIQTLDLTRFTNNEHYTVVELVLHTLSSARLTNNLASQRMEGLKEAFMRESEAFKALHKRFSKNDLNEIDRQLCDKTEYSRQMQELMRMCTDEAVLEAVDKLRSVRAATDLAYRQMVEILNALLVVSPNDELERIQTQMNQQAEYVEYKYQGGKKASHESALLKAGEIPAGLSALASENNEAQVRLMTIPLGQKVNEG